MEKEKGRKTIYDSRRGQVSECQKGKGGKSLLKEENTLALSWVRKNGLSTYKHTHSRVDSR